VYLAADACHDVRTFTAEKGIATRMDSGGGGDVGGGEVECCMHSDKAVAEDTLETMRRLKREGMAQSGGKAQGEIEVVFTHDWRWAQEAWVKGAFWSGRL
jgi:hypothetical protein